MGKKKQRQNVLQKVFLIMAAAMIAGFSYWNLSLEAPVLPAPPLRNLANLHDIQLGIHVDPKKFSDRIYSDIVSGQFNFITIDGGGSHFSEIHPAPNKYNFAGVDKAVNFAQKHNMPVQFHHLAWGDDFVLPGWLTKGKYSKGEIRNILKDHVTTIVKHYKGKIKEYSAVNEALTENKHVYGLNNWWADNLGGDDYMDDVFRWAHAADPDAILLYNDFQNEVINEYSDDMYNYLKAAKAHGVPIDGVGMQLHVNAALPREKENVIKSMQRFASIGLPVYVTEFDINTNKVKTGGQEKQLLESKITQDITRACIESKVCKSFTIFGITSKNDIVKWLTRTDSRAYMFDSRYRPRQAFYTFRQAWLSD